MNRLQQIKEMLGDYQVEIELSEDGRYHVETYDVHGVACILEVFDGLPKTMRIGTAVWNVNGDKMIGSVSTDTNLPCKQRKIAHGLTCALW